ncbi:hypothetical protein B0A52_09414 [Exophiala mesophila]|uniref:VOC domain-containing protein n=1 Tax=Exophiala mesophila TaxID=212818 RepID=A0A438MS88_EXOME|nr:hypothetical protein B0A52_09414 [Exophiala mesophila]
MDWTPPKDGTPCWINVLAQDVKRAKTFYSQIFNWSFTRTETVEGKKLDENEIAMFEVPGQPCPGGGITRVDPDDWNSTEGKKKGVVLYLYVSDIYAYEQKIVAAGGKKTSEIEPEGSSALMQLFEDTEGNALGVYSMKSTCTQ